MICSSLNLERFIVRPLLVTDPTNAWRRFWGSGQMLEVGYRQSVILSPEWFISTAMMTRRRIYYLLSIT
jgi:hypothetical protein